MPKFFELLRSDVPVSSGSSSNTLRPTPVGGGSGGGGGKGKTTGGLGSKGLGGKTARRHRKILRDNILGVTKGDIRRLARRGGVKRISGIIYQDSRVALRSYLEMLLKDICAIVENSGRKTICTTDVVFVLARLGKPIYGFGDAVR